MLCEMAGRSAAATCVRIVTCKFGTTRVASAEQLVGNIDEDQNTSQAEIHFRPGQPALSKQAKNTSTRGPPR